MGFLLFILIFFVLLIITGIVYVLYKLKNNNYEDNISLLEKVFYVTSIIIGLTFIISTIISFIGVVYSEIFFVLFIKIIITFLFLIRLFINGKKLITNLKRNEIFVDSNVEYISKIGLSFIYLALLEMISGLVLQAFYFLAHINPNFTLMLNNELLIYLAVGLLMIVVSKILNQAINIYNEHQLTI